MQHSIIKALEDCSLAIEKLKSPEGINFISKAAQAIAHCFANGHKVIIAGNGGSMCDAAHFAEELTGFFRKPRKALPVIVLSEIGHATCVGNDLGFEAIFSRGVEAFGQPGDIFIGLTTSGNSPNIVKAFEVAKHLGLKTISLLGKNGGKLRGFADFELLIDGFATSDRIQEAHMAALHIVIEEIEEILFYRNSKDHSETLATQTAAACPV